MVPDNLITICPALVADLVAVIPPDNVPWNNVSPTNLLVKVIIAEVKVVLSASVIVKSTSEIVAFVPFSV